MSDDRFISTAADAPLLFSSVEEAHKATLKSLMEVCFAYGFDTVQEEKGSILCGKHSTSQLVEVKQNGDWEFRDADDEFPVTEDGNGPKTLRWFLEQL